MALTICATYCRGLPPGQELTCSIKEKVCTLGRATDCDFVLPDPERVVSNHHATIHLENGTFILTDTSINGTFLNRSLDAVGQGQTVQLQEGDVLTIGDYECRITITEEVETEPETLDGPDAWPMQKPTEIAEAGVARQPELPRVTPDLPEFESEPLVIPESAKQEPASPGLQPLIPDDYDFLSPREEASQSELGQSAEHVPPESHSFRPPEPLSGEPGKLDQLAGAAPLEVATPHEQPEPTLPESISQPEPVTKAQGVEKQLLEAFCAGAGLSTDDVTSDEVSLLLIGAGKLLREMTQGLMLLLSNRSGIKSEFRLDITRMRPTENNPFKFSADVDQALTILLLQKDKGYLPATTATQEAIRDLQAHEMALLAGLRAALNALVARFDPESIEQGFQERSILDSLLPTARESKFWNLFKEVYNQVAADAENDFIYLLGQNFAQAYQQQLVSLKEAQNK